MNKFLLWIIPFLFALSGMGQKANYKLAERFTDRNLKSLVSTTKVSPVFINDGDKFWYRYTTTEGTRYYFVDPRKKLHREMFDREYVAGEISKVTGDVLNAKDLRLSIQFKKDNEDTFSFQVGKSSFDYNLKTNKLVLSDTTNNKKRNSKPFVVPKMRVGTYSPDSTYIVYTKEHNLYLLSIADSVETQLTTDGVKNYSYASDDRGKKPARTKVTWFAEGNSFVVERTDNRGAKPKSFGIVSNFGIRPTAMEYDFEVPGDEITKREELYFFRLDDKKPVKVAVEKWNSQSFTLYPGNGKNSVSKHIYFTRKKRTCEEIDFCKVDSRTGEVKIVFNVNGRVHVRTQQSQTKSST